jgi:hypothetical protein
VGYSGTGYVTKFTAAASQLEIAFTVPAAGLYEVRSTHLLVFHHCIIRLNLPLHLSNLPLKR